MAFIGNTELILLEIGLVGFVGIVVPETIKYLTGLSNDYESLTRDISFAPSYWVYVALMYSILLVFEPLAVYRIRLYGNWVSGVNLSALVVFWILQFFVTLFNTFNTNWLWTASIIGLIAFGLAIATTWLFFQLEIFAGVLMVIVCVIFLFLLILELAIAFHNRAVEAAVCYSKNQATWNGAIGAELPQSNVTQRSAPMQKRQLRAPVTANQQRTLAPKNTPQQSPNLQQKRIPTLLQTQTPFGNTTKRTSKPIEQL